MVQQTLRGGKESGRSGEKWFLAMRGKHMVYFCLNLSSAHNNAGNLLINVK